MYLRIIITFIRTHAPYFIRRYFLLMNTFEGMDILLLSYDTIIEDIY